MTRPRCAAPESLDRELQSQLTRPQSLVELARVCHGVLSQPGLGSSRLASLLVYQRLFATRQARLEMRHNYQTKDVSHAHDVLSMALARAYVESHGQPRGEGALRRALIRNLMSLTPRGGGNGDELRLFILDVMRRHGIREGHRPGIDDPFLEEWHQKLHSSSTPDDIVICEAYIVFQQTGSPDLFYRTLWERGGISREYLKGLPRPLTHAPRYMPQLAADLEHLLWILKQIHEGSGSLAYLIEVSRWQLDGELTRMLESIRDNPGAWWLPGRIVACRQRLRARLDANVPRDPLMIDVALEDLYKSAVLRLDLRALGDGDLIELLSLTLESIFLSCDDESIELCRELWARVRAAPEGERRSPRWPLQVAAALSYVQLMLQSHSDTLQRLLQPRAESLGASLGADPRYVVSLAEEVIRSQSAFACSKLVDALVPRMRRAAKLGPWRVVSSGIPAGQGRVVVARSLSTAGREGGEDEPRVLVVDQVDGTEDLESGVVAVLTPAEVDLLSHVAIRARSAGVMLATCYDAALLAELRSLHGSVVSVTVQGDGVRHETVAGPVCARPSRPGRRAKDDGRSSKSRNLRALAEKLEGPTRLPLSVTLEPELLDEALRSAPRSRSAVEELETALAAHPGDLEPLLAKLRAIVGELPLSEQIVEEIRARVTRARLVPEWTPVLGEAICRNVKRVWASIWNERAYLSRRARGRGGDRPRMGVLIQRLLPAEYAFVVHTRSPIAGSDNEMLIEIVVGLGETLAGNSPGAPLAVLSRKDTLDHRIISYPSKAVAQFGAAQDGSLIVRSDSNDEDLAGFAGAGLYDSYPIHNLRSAWVPYGRERLFWDEPFQRGVFDAIARTAASVEQAMGSPQDIEGALVAGEVYVVQTRNQAGA